MAKSEPLCNPWLVAVWPGMGNVALGAGSYLVEKLGARWLAELSVRDMFEIEHVQVKGGLAKVGHVPRSIFFLWKDPRQQRDMIIFIGEAQPASGGYALCHKLLDYAIDRGVKRFFTFAAMGTQLHPSTEPRVFGVATDKKFLTGLRKRKVQILEDGQISGMNGVLLAAGAERGLEGICLLGEMPFFAVGVPNPRASQAVLKVFSRMVGIRVDLSQLTEQAKATEHNLLELLEKLDQPAESEEGFTIPDVAKLDDDQEEQEDADEEPNLDRKARMRIEALFEQASQNRATALELKQELDRLGVFAKYEDRFLDLFKQAE